MVYAIGVCDRIKSSMVKKGDIVMENFEFKSQICTTKEQSERLLALGIKKETADMYYSENPKLLFIRDKGIPLEEEDFPAWSLGRLLEVTRMKASSQIVPLNNTFDRLIEGIETRIKEGYFNKDYLEERVWQQEI